MDSFDEYVLTMSALFVAFGQEATDERLKAYWLGLSDIPVKSLRVACQRAIMESRKLPVPAELRELAGVVAERHEDAALKAWACVERAANEVGSYKSVDFEDRRINAVIRSLGGWPAILARSPEEFDKWVRKDFLVTYASYSRSGVSDAACVPLTGLGHDGSVRHVNGMMHEHHAEVVAISKDEPKRERIVYAPQEPNPAPPHYGTRHGAARRIGEALKLEN